MDTPELSDISTDMEAGNRFRDASILHFERYLADNPPPGNPADPALPPALKSFNPLGEAFSRGGDSGSIIFAIDPRLGGSPGAIGLLWGGNNTDAGYTKGYDLTYAIPFEYVLDDIEVFTSRKVQNFKRFIWERTGREWVV